MDPWVWAVFLIVIAGMLAIFESFIPSGGILAFLALLVVLVSIILGFQQSTAYGIFHMTVCFVGIPIAALLFVKYWAKTPIGRRILLEERRSEDVLPDSLGPGGLKQLVGRTGTAKSKMLLAGAIEIDDRTYDAFSDGAPIMPGAPIQVVKVRGTRITIHEIMLAEVSPDDPPSEPINDSTQRAVDTIALEPVDDSPLSQSIESLDIEDPFAEE